MTGRVYAIIALGNATLTGVMSGWLLYYYLPPGRPALVPLGLFGLATLASRALHISLSLWIDDLARRTHSSWGRRLPYIIGGALFMPVLFVLLWTPPHASESTANILYLSVVLIAFNLACGIHQTSYEALYPELGLGEKERGMVSNWRMGFLLGGNILAGFAGPLIGSLGTLRSVWIFAAFSAPCLILPGLFLRRGIHREAQPGEDVPSLDGLKTAFGKPAFRVFALTWGLMWLATTFTFETLPYIVTEICHARIADTAILYFAALLISMLAYPAVMWLAKRYGAKAVFRGSLLAGAIVTPGLLLIGKGLPVPLLVQGLVWMVLQSASLAGAQALPGAITAEIGAEGQTTLGNLVDQLASGVALAIIPLFLLLGRSQFDPQGALGVRLLGPAGGVILLAAFVVFGW